MFDAFHWPEGASRRFAVTESFLGSLSADGHVLGYPPIHQHHFHFEDSRDVSPHRAIEP
jgi:hypothetical protein